MKTKDNIISNEDFYRKTEIGQIALFKHCILMEKQGHKRQFELCGLERPNNN